MVAVQGKAVTSFEEDEDSLALKLDVASSVSDLMVIWR
jgi:hypothetical protein